MGRAEPTGPTGRLRPESGPESGPRQFLTSSLEPDQPERPHVSSSLSRMEATIFWTLVLIQDHLLRHVWSALPPPSHVTMDSVNMRHDLRWRPPRAQCSTPLRYSVQFQGEFEATVLNGTWLDSPECQDITRAHCDLSLDLGSDSDYNVSVRARCGSRISSRAQLVAPFNRKRTALTAPDVTASAAGDALLVSFDRAPPAASVEVEVWNRDDAREQVLAFEVSAEQKQLHVTDLRRGATYCVRARLLLEGKMHSRDTRDQCVLVAGPDAPWKSPTTGVLTLLLMVGVASALFWCVAQCRAHHYCRRHFHKEALPRSLLLDAPVATVVPREPDQEVCADVRVVPKARR
ncbi:cytokine receptor family member B16 isoform X2 [Syngnathoides biaculeatus]|uniref:cytokine receptor family member B16 isoform X2 n=1 Tax=Syngnathoides biaculeatus TaxID=300417 RepID=UPI002ADD43C3|nr:cytokine receptor family member B16 isoform X2 [Syngnathoides biaculeatus]